tara:strand:+ start:105 stop:563 length:459 start_codon:yes stop_codon:yes gene_type:complete
MNKIKHKGDNTQKCEFVLTLGKNIVCQRFFSVRNFNPKAAQSLDLHYMVKDIMVDLTEDLKWKTLLLLESSFRESNNELSRDSEEEYFTITIKKGNKIILTRSLQATMFPPKVRYTVDIRPRITTILRELTDVLSSKKVDNYYQDYCLIVNE